MAAFPEPNAGIPLQSVEKMREVHSLGDDVNEESGHSCGEEIATKARERNPLAFSHVSELAAPPRSCASSQPTLPQVTMNGRAGHKSARRRSGTE